MLSQHTSIRFYRLKEIKMYGIVKDIFIYAIFVVALCTVSYDHLDPRSYMFRKGIEDNIASAAYGGDMEFSSVRIPNSPPCNNSCSQGATLYIACDVL